MTKGLILAALAVIVLLYFAARKPADVPKPAAPQVSRADENIRRPQPAGPPPTSSSPAEAASVLPSTNYVSERVAALNELGASNDPDSFRTIVSEFTNRDPRIRKAAREAARQFGSRDAVPALRQAAEQVDDPVEKSEFLEVANFLALPSFSEYAAAKAARGTKPAPTIPQGKGSSLYDELPPKRSVTPPPAPAKL